MRTYTFKQPLMRMNQTPFDLLDESGRKVGSIQRFYRKGYEKMLDLVFDNWVCHVRVTDADRRERAVAEEEVSLQSFVRERWSLTLHEAGGSETLNGIRKTKIKTNPRLLFENDRRGVLITRDIGDKNTRFLDQATGQILAEASYESVIPPRFRNITIRVHAREASIYEIACLYYVFALKY